MAEAFARVVALALAWAALTSHAHGQQAPAFNCGPLVRYWLQADGTPEGEAGGLHFLLNDFDRRMDRLVASAQASCRAERTRAIEHLVGVIRQRWLAWLREGELERFQSAYHLVVRADARPQAQAAVRTLFQDLEREYVLAALRELRASLRESPWARFESLPISIEAWGPSWTRDLGREALAAVGWSPADPTSARVALASFDLPPGVLEVALFHELSHIDDWMGGVGRTSASPGPRDHMSGEVRAWRETFAYLGWRRAQGLAVPQCYARAEDLAARVGLSRWVGWVVRSRGMGAP